jgi:hypothetical protein
MVSVIWAPASLPSRIMQMLPGGCRRWMAPVTDAIIRDDLDDYLRVDYGRLGLKLIALPVK